ncbi:hypothetical protein INT45_002744 [Circinella minor]|uniref:Uncharacterized protein n=1 Tax=Circinella minor TaxID=1195481 RepID=A0A8H7VG38_9FUNG|nr:hypothetical protein INT45_002744 [Circinella minor]
MSASLSPSLTPDQVTTPTPVTTSLAATTSAPIIPDSTASEMSSQIAHTAPPLSPTPRVPTDPSRVHTTDNTPRPSVTPMSVEPGFFDDEQLRIYYLQLKNNYQDLVNYIYGRKQALLNQRDEILRGIEGVTTSFPYISQPQRAQIESVLLRQQQEALTLDQHITNLDQQLHVDRQAMAHEFHTAFTQHPDHFQNLLMDTEWPTAEVCQDLHLSPPLIHFVRQTLTPIPHNSPLTATHQLHDMQQRLLELEASIQQQQQLHHTTTISQSTQQPISSELPSTARLSATIHDRRQRIKIPKFSNGDPTTAQHWLETYTRTCDFLHFTLEDRLDELNVTLEGPAIKWFSTLRPDQQ